MKKLNILKSIVPAFAVILALSSCLKDDNVDQDFSKLKPMVEFSDATPKIDGSVGKTIVGVVGNTAAVEYFIPINYASDKPSPGVEVTVALDQSTLDAYNTANGTHREILPSEYFKIESLKVTIPSGQHTGLIKISFLNTLDPNLLTKSYALPFKITSVTGDAVISGNYGTLIGLFSIKNIYDGSYSADGSLAFPPPQAGRSWANRAKKLVTVNTTTSSVEAADLGSSGYIMYLKVNPDNTVTVTPAPNAATQTIQNDGPCTYDPATKTFNLKYKYVGGTGDRKISEVIKLNQ